MTDEAKRCVEHLRNNAEFQWCSDCYISDGCGDAYKANCYFLRIADLIESLSAELEQVKQERDGLNIMYTNASSSARTHKRERDETLDMIAEFGTDHPCDEFSLSEYCENCRYDSPQRECWLRYIQHRLVEKEENEC